MTKRQRRHEHFLRRHKEVEDVSKLSESLAPPEENRETQVRDAASTDDKGLVSLDTGKLQLPKGFVEDDDEKRGLFGLEPVILFIMALMILFIAFITYMVYRMPSK